MTDTQRGLMLAFTGIIILSLDSLMVKLVAAAPLDLLFWRGAMQAGCLCSYLLIFDRQQLSKQLRQLNPLTITVSLLFAASSICFIESLAHTAVTSTLVIINTAPLFTAIIAFIFLREKLPLYSVLAIAATVGGVWIIFSHAPGESQLKGDLYALVTALSTAVYLVSMRFTQGKNAAALIIMAGIFIALFALAAGATPSHVQSKHLLFAIFLGGVVVPVSYMFISNAPRYIPAAQTGLILLLEIFLGPLFVYLALGDKPSNMDILGGLLVLVTLTLHTLWELHLTRRQRPLK